MEIDSTNQENVGAFTKGWNKLKDFPRKFKKKVGKIAKNTKQIGKDDPRKIWHAFKVGLALTLVSLFYYTEPLYHSFDQPIIWAVLTVVVTFEFTAGATILKSINRGIGTTLAGAFGVGAKYLAELIGKERPDPIVLGVLVFFVGAFGTFTRFYPHIKRKYDYGTMIFVLTFSLVAVSGYRSEDIFLLAQRRISTILIGVFIVMIISMVIHPVWAGEDLHKLVSTNLEKLASFLQGFGSEYFHISEIESVEGTKTNEKEFVETFLSVFGSKATEESLATIEFEKKIEEACKRMIMESNKALKELSMSIKTMTQPFSSIIHVSNAKNIINGLKHTLGTSKNFFRHDKSRVMDFVPAASIVSSLVDVIRCVDEIYEAVEELSSKAHFVKKEKKRRDLCTIEAVAVLVAAEKPQLPRLLAQILHRGTVNLIVEDDMDGDDFVTIEIVDNVESKTPNKEKEIF
ncbi:hypothetical protein HAX54_010235 [Datura stramonium]|uniref:Aluminum-activated malate transporter n=1 Tax=Datura stramonium TaxID=4076 RepID=A0ABS8RZ01_DATST|nr:hypothetical protein [Datura stramonium]